ncbi:MAG: NAD(P)/FAD-dependent oxidoreductase [Acidobacteriota bacterium]|nr:NAD(P)/FAD-dependent oxidoreductase [Acidobacteriota bacterium]
MYDALVVGARCAGSATAFLLARKGYKVLLVDRASFPSDLPFSTHYIHQSGIAYLKRWGVLDRIVASNCPPITEFYFDFGSFALSGRPPVADGVKEAYAPRRKVLDAILVDAASASGVEVRTGFSVNELLSENGCVCGIRGREQGGSTIVEKARIVIGADGMHSTVARLAGAQEYNVKPPPQGPYFSYWSGVQMRGFEFYPGPYRGAFGWMTNNGLALIGVGFAAKDHPVVRVDIEGNYLRTIREDAPGLAERIQRGHREERFVGGVVPNYFRKPFGAGWALVGDAGYLKDPCTAEGITDAFHSADLLARALDSAFIGRQAFDEALAWYEQERNKAAFPLYEFTCQLGTLAPPTAEMQQLLYALKGNQEQTDRFFGVFAQTVSVPEFFAPENMQRILRRD